MINQITKDKIARFIQHYQSVSDDQHVVLRGIALAEIPEMVYNSNIIENSTLTLKETEDILLRGKIVKNPEISEAFKAKNLAKVTVETYSRHSSWSHFTNASLC